MYYLVILLSSSPCTSTATRRTIHGVLGLINMPLADYLVVINRKTKIGDLVGNSVWRVESVDFIPLASTSASTSVEIDSHNRCNNLVREMMETPYFYFSYSGDLTNTLQRQNDRPAVMEKEDSWKIADKRFIWNNFIANNILQYAEESSKSAVSSFLVQIVHGAMFIQKIRINGVSNYTKKKLLEHTKFCTFVRKTTFHSIGLNCFIMLWLKSLK